MTVDKKTDAKSDESFLSRWSRVKHEGDDGQAESRPLADSPNSASGLSTESKNASIGGLPRHKMAEDARPERTLPDSTPQPLPTLDSLSAQSDFSPFMAKDVDPQLRNQAMKKLFSDPHYNVMDRLDTYIDDYSIETPLSTDIIRQMSISKTLRLFDDEDEKENAAVAEPGAPTLLSADAAVPLSAASKAPDEHEVEPVSNQHLKHSPD